MQFEVNMNYMYAFSGLFLLWLCTSIGSILYFRYKNDQGKVAVLSDILFRFDSIIEAMYKFSDVNMPLRNKLMYINYIRLEIKDCSELFIKHGERINGIFSEPFYAVVQEISKRINEIDRLLAGHSKFMIDETLSFEMASHYQDLLAMMTSNDIAEHKSTKQFKHVMELLVDYYSWNSIKSFYDVFKLNWKK